MGIANAPPNSDFPMDQFPKLTVQMVARIQGFPDSWQFQGKKTIAYRQVGNAFPPPVAHAVGLSISRAFSRGIDPSDSRQERLLENETAYKINDSKKRLKSANS
jgi:DNA (cytosine-5)-methyltransferase 1